MTDNPEDLCDRVDELEEYAEFIADNFDEWRDTRYRRDREEAAAERDDARTERVELQAAVDTLERRVSELERKMDSLIGVDDAADSNPRKRANDLRLALLRDAEERSDQHAGKSQMWWEEVQRLFAQIGHGNVAKPDCYKAMEWAAGVDGAPTSFQRSADGFELTKKTNEKGNEVKAVSVDAETASYADTALEAPSSNPTTTEGGRPAMETD